MSIVVVNWGYIVKANEINSQAVMFVKKFGWDAAIDLWCGAFDLYNNDLQILNGMVCSFSDNHFLFDLVDLKRLIESYELVAIHGFEKSKEIVANAPSDDYFYSWTLGDSGVRDKTVNIGELRKAIADVESCQ